MIETQGFSIRIYLPTGDPDGIRVIEKTGWTGQGFFFPRSIYPQIRDNEELKRTGVYILWNPGDGGQFSHAYIGEGDGLLDRLESHQRERDFWTFCIAFTSKDQYLNKAHVQHLEARLIELAKDSGRCELENRINPQRPSLSEADRAEAEQFLRDMLLCLPFGGITFFEKSSIQEDQRKEFFINSGPVSARGYETTDGFVVSADSKAARNETPTLPAHISNLRKILVAQGTLKEEGNVYSLVTDHLFTSPSNAAKVMLGRNVNGRTSWKDADNKTLAAIQESGANA